MESNQSLALLALSTTTEDAGPTEADINNNLFYYERMYFRTVFE